MSTDHTDENGENLRRVWCVVYDSDTPRMDGSHDPCCMTERSSREIAERDLRTISVRSARSSNPKRNLRIETRLVSDWQVIPPGLPTGGDPS